MPQLRRISEHSSGAPFARQFQDWWESHGKKQFKSKRKFATALGKKNPLGIYAYFAGRAYPRSPGTREALYRVTGLECFNSGTTSARHLHICLRRLSTPWAKNLLIKAYEYFDSVSESNRTRNVLYVSAYRILTHAVQDRITSPNEITPEKLIRFPLRYKDKHIERWVLASFTRFLVAQGLWRTEQSQKLNGLLGDVYTSKKQQQQWTPGPTWRNRSTKLVKLVKELALKGGLTDREIRNLRVSQIETNGIRLGPRRLLLFGEGRHSISRQLFDSWLNEAEPKDFLFYQRAPRNYYKPIGRRGLDHAIRDLGLNFTIEKRTKGTQLPLRQQHFREDFQQAKNLREFRLHMRDFHAFTATGSRKLIKQLLRQMQVFPLPVPYFLAVICATRLLPREPNRRQGGRVWWCTWPSLLGHYDVRVTWPSNFSRFVKTNWQKVAVALYGLAWEFWFARWQAQENERFRDRFLNNFTRLRKNEKRLLAALEKTQVRVRDTITDSTWTGALFENRYRKKFFRLPLQEDLEGRPTHPKCKACLHADRDGIDKKIINKTPLKRIERKYGVPYNTLREHAGKIKRPYRGEVARSHMSLARTAPTLRFPINFIEHIWNMTPTALILYPLLLLEGERAKGQQFTISPTWFQQQLGFSATEHELSLALNLLAQRGFIEISSKTPSGFSVLLLQ